jgi:cytochrome c-type biogenesis protein CcmH
MFWILAAVLGIAALGFVLRPLLKPPVEDPHAGKRRALRAAHAAGALDADELQQRLLALPPEPAAPQSASRGLVLGVALLLPALAVGLYLQVGRPEALDPAIRSAPTQSAPSTVEEAMAALEARLKAEPTDLEGWVLLGRSARQLEQFGKAEAALEQAHRLAPEDVEILIDYAEAKALAGPQRRIEGEALALLQRARSLQPDNARARWLLGVAAMQGDRPAEAVELWQGLFDEMPADVPARAALGRQLNEARQRAGMAPLDLGSATAPSPTPAAPAATDSEVANGPRIEVAVSLDPALADRVPEGAVLFVFARAPQGSRAPLAIQRLSAASLPATVVLTDAMGMIAGMNLSSQPQVVLGARISASGNAAPQPGDLEGLSAPVEVATGRAQVRIDRVLP